jgi:hypothetical protein
MSKATRLGIVAPVLSNSSCRRLIYQNSEGTSLLTASSPYLAALGRPRLISAIWCQCWWPQAGRGLPEDHP